VFAHDLPVEIKARLPILPECCLRDQVLKILLSLGVNFRGINVSARRQVNFRFADVQKAQRIAGGDLPRLIRRHHVVRQFANAVRQFRLWPQGGEWFDHRHKSGGKIGTPPKPRTKKSSFKAVESEPACLDYFEGAEATFLKSKVML